MFVDGNIYSFFDVSTNVQEARVSLFDGTHTVRFAYSGGSRDREGRARMDNFRIAPLTFGYWLELRGLSPATSPDTDLDRDGIGVLLEYALGGEPYIADRWRLPEFSFENGEATITASINGIALRGALDLHGETSHSMEGPWTIMNWTATDETATFAGTFGDEETLLPPSG